MTEAQDVVKNWILKANNDLKTGKDEMETDEPATDTICFHMQQCVEKYLKGYLVFHEVDFRKTHDIAELIELCKSVSEKFEELYSMDADSLTVYAAEIRYPDDFYMPTLEETRDCIDIAVKAMEFVKEELKKDGYQFPGEEQTLPESQIDEESPNQGSNNQA
ncbi:MAG: HEPN domain-containing protein [Candidatus Aminicenantes bacterium]|nr:HEPN domain-containing protein [Candidatus Aminicenantes bacterium]NIQ71575.1 HEPN domain-containing protein [Candidatus Aminicenantes bacterium]NIT27626.1 HEPN domain-containing protein [Candidatus Aminicenantes bacterium]